MFSFFKRTSAMFKKRKFEQSSAEDPDRSKRPRTETHNDNSTPQAAVAISTLSPIHKIPVEMFLEIFRQLTPKDLLQLARASKHFMAILTDPKNKSAWKAAREIFQNTEGLAMPAADVPHLPDCPPFMTELMYATIMFEPARCQACGMDRVRGCAQWELGVRYCGECLESRVVDEDFFSDEMSEMLAKACMKATPRHDEVTEIDHNGGVWADRMYLREDAARIKALVKEAKTKGAVKAVLQEHRTRILKIRKHARLCCSWELARARHEKKIRKEIIARRLQDIVAKLEELGYKEEVPYLGSSRKALLKHPGVEIVQALSDEDWEGLRSGLVDFMEERKKRRLDWERVSFLRNKRLPVLDKALARLRTQATINDVVPDGFPHAIDFITHPAIQELIDAPGDEPATDAAISAALPGAIDDWRNFVASELAALHPAGTQAPPNWLQLASTAFTCKTCHDVYSWPAVATHTHVDFLERCQSFTPPDVGDALRAVPGTRCAEARYQAALRGLYAPRLPWHPMFELCGARAGGVFAACGMDAGAATCEQMDKLDARFMCRACSNSGKLLAMGWRAAVYHSGRAHLDVAPSELEWARLGTRLEREIKKAEKLLEGKCRHEYDDEKTWWCGHCGFGVMAPAVWRDVRYHWTETHRDLSQWKSLPDRRDLYPSLDQLPFMGPEVPLKAKGKKLSVAEEKIVSN